MKKALKISAWSLGILIIAAALAWFGFLKPEPPPISEEDRAQISLMPLPAKLKLGEGDLLLGEHLAHDFTGLSTPRLERAMERFYKKLSSATGMNFGQGGDCYLILNCRGKEMAYPALGDDESYTLKITSRKIVVKAATETGMLYALESLLQLVTEKEGVWTLPQLTLQDAPRFPWRGLMIDACRHWIPKDVILRNLEAMGTLKMNVFHWHLTENQGFRVESRIFPGLHEQGSGGDYYTQEEISEVIEFAADRGIRVVPEFDLPGHSTSWFVAYPELASAPGPYVPDTVFGILDPVMDPTREEVYDFLNRFFGEMSELFPDPYIHIGGDEVHAAHWDQNPEIQAFAKEKGLEDAHALQAYFNIRVQEILAGHGKLMMGWDEILHPDLPKEGIVVQTWRDHSSLWEAARKGHLAVLSAGYYLDYKQPAGYHYRVDPEVISGVVDIEIDSTNWRSWEGDSIQGTGHFAIFKMPFKGHRNGGTDMKNGEELPIFRTLEPLTTEEKKKLIGGEACMWSEMVDGRTMESRIWPRAAAVGEKLWSPGSLSADIDDLYRRLIHMDEHLEHLGLKHRTYRNSTLQDLAPEHYQPSLRILTSLLQEDKFFARMELYDPQLYTFTPLTRMVDAAPPESYTTYLFDKKVDRWLTTRDPGLEEELTRLLETWAENHEKLAPAFENSVSLSDIEPHSIHLSSLSKLGLEAIHDPATLQGREKELESLFKAAGASYGGCMLPLSASVQKLVSSAFGN